MQGAQQIRHQRAFERGPGRGHQFAGRGIALQTVHDQAGRNARQGRAEQVHIFVALQGLVAPVPVPAGQFRALGHINIVQFEAVQGQAHGPVHAFQKSRLALAGQTGHQMPADQQAAPGGFGHGFGRAGRRMPPVDPGQSGVMGALQAQLQPDLRNARFGPGPEQSVQLGRAQAVGPRTHGQAAAVRQGRDRVQQVLQTLQGAVGIGKGLQIGQETTVRVPGAVLLPPGLPLGRQGQAAPAQARARTQGVAEDTTPRGQQAVAVGTGRTGVKWNFLHPHAVLAVEIRGQSMPTHHTNAPCGRIRGCSGAGSGIRRPGQSF